MIVYGRNAVRETLRAGRRPVTELLASERPAREPWLRDAPAPLRIAGDEELSALCGSPAHQGVCARAGAYPYVDEDALLAGPEPLIVALDEVQDPQNLGAVARSAECAGASGLALCERRAAEVTPAVCKASAGAVEHLAIARVGNLANFLARAKSAGCWCYGADAAARTSYDSPDYGGGVVLVLGAEGKGLRPRVAAACDALVALPLRGRIGSLNVGAAASVLLYEILRARLDNAP